MSTVWCRCQEDGSRWCRSFSCCSSGVSQLLHRVCYINVYSFLSIYDGWLLSTHADRQGVDISFTVCLFLFVRLRISPARIKLAESNFARWFIGVLVRECPILKGTLLPQTPKIGRWRDNRYIPLLIVNVTLQMPRSWNIARRVNVGRHVWIYPTDVLVWIMERYFGRGLISVSYNTKKFKPPII